MFKEKCHIKKLVVTHPDHGHLELVVDNEIETEFKKIMKEGYGNKVPAVFHAEKKDGSVEVAKGKDAGKFLRDPDVQEVTVIAPLAGG